MRILHLSARDVKRLRAVEITPDGNVVVVGGKNGQGKTSVLDSIMYALGGKDLTCSQPVRRGAERAEICIDLGEITVKRTITADGGGQLVLENKEGARFTAPQGRLDDLIGRLSFDPLEFSRMAPNVQAETLRALLGIDFSELDGRRARAYEHRADVNRDAKALRARVAAMVEHPGVGTEETPTSTVIDELDAAQAVNESNARARARVETMIAEGQALVHRQRVAVEAIAKTEAEIERLRARLAEEVVTADGIERELDDARAAVKAERDRVTAMVDVDLQGITARLSTLDAANRLVRENAERAALATQLADAEAESASMSAAIEAIDAEKAALLAAAGFPVPELGFDATGVTLNGLPFDQASAAEQLRVSVAIGIALNPKLRVLLIRDGSLLDAESLALVAGMAAEHDAQLWLERVEADGATVVIEDGAVLEAAPAEVAR